MIKISEVKKEIKTLWKDIKNPRLNDDDVRGIKYSLFSSICLFLFILGVYNLTLWDFLGLFPISIYAGYISKKASGRLLISGICGVFISIFRMMVNILIGIIAHQEGVVVLFQPTILPFFLFWLLFVHLPIEFLMGILGGLFTEKGELFKHFFGISILLGVIGLIFFGVGFITFFF